MQVPDLNFDCWGIHIKDNYLKWTHCQPRPGTHTIPTAQIPPMPPNPAEASLF